MSRVDETSSQAQCLVPSQWTEIDCREWCAATARAPRGVKRVALDARSHNQEAGTVSHCRGERRKLPKDLRIGPMEIFDNHQCRCTATSMRGERSCKRGLAAVTWRVVHGAL